MHSLRSWYRLVAGLAISLVLTGIPANAADFFDTCGSGTAEQVALMIARGADVSVRNEFGFTPLFIAAQENARPEVIVALVKAGADVNAKNPGGMAPLMAAAAFNPSNNVIEALINAGADVKATNNSGNTPLMFAVNSNLEPLTKVIAALVKAGADVNARDKGECTALMFAARHNSVEVVVALIQAGADVKAIDVLGSTPLMCAAMSNTHSEVIVALVKAGADVNIKDKDGRTALDWARTIKNAPSEKALIAAGAAEVSLPPLVAVKSPATQPGHRVGSVYGKVVTAAGIALAAPIDPNVSFDAQDSARWSLMGRIMMAFGRPIVDRFVVQQKIEATAEEIQAFRTKSRKSMEEFLHENEGELAKAKAELAGPKLTGEARAKLEETRAMQERIVAGLREATKAEAPETMARAFIVAWKTERELHRTHGGRVIFQQAGPEALDAHRLLYEEAEKRGDLKFDDAGVRHLFYYYSVNMKHVVMDEKAIEQPWFLDGK